MDNWCLCRKPVVNTDFDCRLCLQTQIMCAFIHCRMSGCADKLLCNKIMKWNSIVKVKRLLGLNQRWACCVYTNVYINMAVKHFPIFRTNIRNDLFVLDCSRFSMEWNLTGMLLVAVALGKKWNGWQNRLKIAAVWAAAENDAPCIVRSSNSFSGRTITVSQSVKLLSHGDDFFYFCFVSIRFFHSFLLYGCLYLLIWFICF